MEVGNGIAVFEGFARFEIIFELFFMKGQGTTQLVALFQGLSGEVAVGAFGEGRNGSDDRRFAGEQAWMAIGKMINGGLDHGKHVDQSSGQRWYVFALKAIGAMADDADAEG